MKSIINIQPTGSFFEIDNEGCLINPASEDKLQERWKPAIADIIDAYKQAYGNSLNSVYIRGSVAKGKAIEYISDIDAFSYVDLPKKEIDNKWKRDFRDFIDKKYPFINGIELGVISSEGKDNNLILNQSLLVYGEIQPIKKIKLGKDLILHSYDIENHFKGTLKRLEENNDEEFVRGECQWAMKGIVRMGLELVLERSGKYSRDLYPCYKVFSEYYPGKEPEMREVLYLALNPTSDKRKIEDLINGLGKWLRQEIKRKL